MKAPSLWLFGVGSVPDRSVPDRSVGAVRWNSVGTLMNDVLNVAFSRIRRAAHEVHRKMALLHAALVSPRVHGEWHIAPGDGGVWEWEVCVGGVAGVVGWNWQRPRLFWHVFALVSPGFCLEVNMQLDATFACRASYLPDDARFDFM